MYKLLFVAVIVTLGALGAFGLLAACGESGGGASDSGGGVTLPADPADAALQLLEYIRNDQGARQWAILHPAHQAIASRSAYIQCPFDTVIGSAKVIEVFEEKIPVPELGDVNTTAVTIERSAEIGGNEVSDRSTIHLLDVGGEWRWILGAQGLEAYAAGDCP